MNCHLPSTPLRLDAPSTPSGLITNCVTCMSRQTCLPKGLDDAATTRFNDIVSERRRVLKGTSAYSVNQLLTSLYAVRLGQFKTVRGNPQGREQIIGFHMSGNLMGMDALATEHPVGNAIALEDSEVCHIPIVALEHLTCQMPILLSHFHRLLSGEILRDQNLIAQLGGQPAERRLAVFLINLSTLSAHRGYSATSLRLRMSREEVGNYLGITVESVSRMLLRLKNRGWIDVDLRSIDILAPVQLREYATEVC